MRSRTTTFFLSVLVVVALVGAAAVVSAEDATARLWTAIESEGGIPADARLDMSSFARLAKKLKPTVVNISVTKTVRPRMSRRGTRDPFFRFFGPSPEGYENKGLGSGFVINAEGYILTNYHVVEEADEVIVRFPDGKRYPADIVGADPPTDMALIKIQAKESISVAPLGDSDILEVGEWVLAIGNPFGLSHTVTAGIVSAKGRKEVAPEGKRLIANFIQTDASINPGNSGGPLFNIRGEVIGMATAINRAGQGIGFAIPVNMIKTLLPQLMEGHVQRSWLGVMIRPVTEEHVGPLGLSSAEGAIIAKVQPDSPASEGGIQAGDVIVAFDGEKVESTADLQWFASTAETGKKVAVEIVRRGKHKTVQVKMRALPDRFVDGPRFGRGLSKKDSRDATVEGVGVRVADITASLRRKLHIQAKRGVVITEIDRGSAADMAGLKAGDVVLVVGTKAVKSADGFREAIGEVKPGKLVSLVLSREGETLSLDLHKASR